MKVLLNVLQIDLEKKKAKPPKWLKKHQRVSVRLKQIDQGIQDKKRTTCSFEKKGDACNCFQNSTGLEDCGTLLES